tara:strand:- start:6070 stop:6648 length:579 start_codon:yes stop_codon:yes gene_type:complete
MYWLLMKKNHYADVEMRTLQPRDDVIQMEDKNLLSDFIVNTIDERTLGQKLGIKDKKRRFNAEYYGILETFTTVIGDMIQKMRMAATRVARDADALSVIHNFRVETLSGIVELSELAEYLTKSVDTLCQNYGYERSKFKNDLKDLQKCIGYLFQRMSVPREWKSEWIPRTIVVPEENWWPPRGFLMTDEYRY